VVHLGLEGTLGVSANKLSEPRGYPKLLFYNPWGIEIEEKATPDMSKWHSLIPWGFNFGGKSDPRGIEIEEK
jgi:hypothetical protein